MSRLIDVATGLFIVPERDALLTPFARKLLADFYLKFNETPQQGYARAARAWCGGDLDLAQRLYDGVSKGWFMFASPVLSNAPLPGERVKGMPISCFLNYVGDSLEDLIDHSAETRWLAVLGGGVGGHWSSVRAVSDKAPGVIPFLHTIDADMQAYMQGKVRRGSYAAYLDVSHPDLMEFLSIRVPTGDASRKCHSAGFHHALNITDEFMQAVIDDAAWNLVDPNDSTVRETMRARALWEQILETRYRTGEPYLHFIDTANRALPESQKKLSLRINGSNLCVAGDTPLLTDKGYLPIGELQDQDVKVWNGRRWSATTVRRTGRSKSLVTVKLSDGSEIACTPEHRFFVQPSYQGREVERRARELQPGDKLSKWEMPVIESGETWENPYLNGFFTADGTYSHIRKPIIWLYGEKRNLHERLMIEGAMRVVDQTPVRDAIYLQREMVRPKYEVPVNGDLKTKLEWLAGFCDGDGTIARNGTNQQLQMASTNLVFLRDLRLMLGTMGVQGKIANMAEAGMRAMPDGHGALKQYYCEESYRLLVTSVDLQRLMELGFSPSRLSVVKHEPRRDARQFVTVEAVVDEGRVEDTFCFTEPEFGKGVFNGILTGNCAEIELPTSEGRTAVCCLSSLNAETYDEWKNSTIVEDLIEMLDNVLEYFIQRAPEPLRKARYSAMQERALGLGMMGFHSYLQKHSVAFESEGARRLNNEIFGLVKARALEATLRLGRELGEAPDMKGTGRRASHLLALAPNANSAILLDTSPSIEPSRANAYVHRTRAGSWPVKNRHLEALLEAKGRNTDEVWQDIILSKGSVQHLDFLTEHEKAVFKTAIELDQMWIVTHAADRQRHICQGQSLNLFFPPNADRAYLNRVHLAAWQQGVKALYYTRSEAPNRAEVVSRKIERVALADAKDESGECVACQG